MTPNVCLQLCYGSMAKKNNNVLFIGAHFDDIEISCGGTAIRYYHEGRNTYGLVLTKTNYERGSRLHRDPIKAKREAERSGKITRMNLINLDYDLNELTYGKEVVYSIRDIIESYKIDSVFTHWEYDIHPDHRNASIASLSASRHVSNVFMYKSNDYEALHPFAPNYFVDVSKFHRKKMMALKCYRSEVTRKGTDFYTRVYEKDKLIGKKNNVKFAEAFVCIKTLS